MLPFSATRFDPIKEVVRLVNELSWREQFECLDYAQKQAQDFGLPTLANQLTAELKRVARCIRIISTVQSNKAVNGTSML
jgi:hypothetical protein